MGEEHAGSPTGPTRARDAVVAGLPGATYPATVEDHVMVARPLPHPASGPAQRTHGATSDVAARLLDSPVIDSPALAPHRPSPTRPDVVLREQSRASAGVGVDLTGRAARPEAGAGGPVAP